MTRMHRISLALVLGFLSAGECLAGAKVELMGGIPFDACKLRGPHEEKQETAVWHLTLPFETAGYSTSRELGTSVSNLLHLTIWRDLRRTEFSGSGTAFRSFSGLSSMDCQERLAPSAPGSVQAVRELALRNKMDMVLWGYTYRVGEDVIAQPMLTMNPQSRPLGWLVNFDRFGETWSFEVTKKYDSYELASLVLHEGQVRHLSAPERLLVCRDRFACEAGSDANLGQLGLKFRALRHEGNWAEVETENSKGWVNLEGYEAGMSEASWFNSGIVRLLRRDWRGALEMFQQVVERDGATLSSDVVRDSYLSAALASMHAGQRGRALEYVDKAWQLNRYDRDAAAFKLATQLEAVARSDRGALEMLCGLFVEIRPLFEPDDALISKTRRLLTVARENGEALGPSCSRRSAGSETSRLEKPSHRRASPASAALRPEAIVAKTF